MCDINKDIIIIFNVFSLKIDTAIIDVAINNITNIAPLINKFISALKKDDNAVVNK